MTHSAVPHTATDYEVDDKADTRGLGIGEVEGERVGHGRALGQGGEMGRLMWGGGRDGRRERRRWVAAVGQVRERERD